MNKPAIGGRALKTMRKRGGRWVAFENHDLSSSTRGQVQFIQYGPDCTHKQPPKTCPDTQHGLGWRFVRIGFVDLASGAIVDQEPE